MFTSVLIKDLMNKKYALSAIAFSVIMSSAAIFPAAAVPEKSWLSYFPNILAGKRGMVREPLQLLKARDPFSCSVCMEGEGNKLVVSLPCAAKHQMCVACAHGWHIGQNKNQCVICRQNVLTFKAQLPRLLAAQQALDESADNSSIRVVQQHYQEKLKECFEGGAVLVKHVNHAREALRDNKPDQATLLALQNKNVQFHQARAINQRRIGELFRQKEELAEENAYLTVANTCLTVAKTNLREENADLREEVNLLGTKTFFFLGTSVISISMLAAIGGVKLYGGMRGGNKGGYQD